MRKILMFVFVLICSHFTSFSWNLWMEKMLNDYPVKAGSIVLPEGMTVLQSPLELLDLSLYDLSAIQSDSEVQSFLDSVYLLQSKPGGMVQDQEVLLLLDQTLKVVALLKYHPAGHAEVLLDVLAVDPAYRGLGYARLLLDIFERLMRSKQITSISLVVSDKNHKAIKLYQVQGYKIQDLN